ncbi:aminotransferase class I/II-fold pyridoxal phosphate-dependent enzyme [Reyranella sp.]|uniref:aminotransferase class I/II-fold pyridoxal phosphate-dependent enzyme n=1 Tax=Reyranella sp. TaxID=1929291 RepID=UPI003BA8FA1C
MSAYSRNDAKETADKVRHLLRDANAAQPTARAAGPDGPKRPGTGFDTLPEYEILKLKKAVGDIAGIPTPFFRLHEGRAGSTTIIDGRTVVNFSSYDYLGLNEHEAVANAAKAAIDGLGTSVSASRLSGGERQLHRDLDAALARLHGTEDALAFVSGHATNVSVIGTLLGPEDLIVGDAVVHNSILEGARLSGARRILTPHGDLEALERTLRLNRARHRRVLLVVEGLYGMDGDVPDLAALVRLKRRYDAWLMVDEAHSIGVLGATGRGIAEEQGVDPADVDIWMGTLSKALAAMGGYIAGCRPLIEILKDKAPGFVFSVGLAPPVAAAALAALTLMREEPWRVAKLRENGRAFLQGARARGLDTGPSIGAAVVPIMIGNSPHAVILSQRLLARGFNIVPAFFPGVAENQARLRFFLTSQHTAAQIDSALDAVADELEKVRNGPPLVSLVTKR